MMAKFKKPDTFDNFVTEKVDVIQNNLLGDYNSNGKYVINKKIINELIDVKKIKKESYNNSIFIVATLKSGRKIDFQIDFKKNTASGLAAAELCTLEPVTKQGGRLNNIIKTPVAKYTSALSPDFIDIALKAFNVIINEEDNVKDKKDDTLDEYIIKRNMLLNALNKLTVDSYNIIYEDYFTQRLNLLKQTNNAYSKKVLSIFNEEFSKMSDYFLVDKKSKKVTNYKAMNELLDKACEDLSGLDNYTEQEKQYRERILPILGMFITSAERIEKSAQHNVLDTFPKRTKDGLTEPLVDIKQTQESRMNMETKETNPEIVTKEIKNKMDRIKEKVSNNEKEFQPIKAQPDAQMGKVEPIMVDTKTNINESVLSTDNANNANTANINSGSVREKFEEVPRYQRDENGDNAPISGENKDEKEKGSGEIIQKTNSEANSIKEILNKKANGVAAVESLVDRSTFEAAAELTTIDYSDAQNKYSEGMSKNK